MNLKKNLEISNSDNSDNNIINVLKRKIDKQVNTYVKHKATKKLLIIILIIQKMIKLN